ncbi:toxin-antitoxin system YwqK family antitoxin [Tepidibacter aestuarii]|uniref:toxin-antitoxin system YwqK family antitoxin n=1 Tax=Tepidibacter aestuarii TaxID=2925782 RepID=UPI0020BEA862|nr:hypothetical protein [Tepidibacter aestuarii]CAH2214824.1 putative antitoxin YwqK [Tepidibacter aestuarii]
MGSCKNRGANVDLFKYAINVELLEYIYCGDMLFYKEKPFTGLRYELYPEGQLRSLTPYENGFNNGICREWYTTGELMCEYESKRGVNNGSKTYWHQNGLIKSIANYELGIELDYKEWNGKGNLVKSRKFDPDNQK